MSKVVPIPTRRAVIPSQVLAMMIFIVAEAMLFLGLISGFLIVKARVIPAMWPPPNQPRLPIEATAVTTAILLVSGVVLFWAGKRFAKDASLASLPLLVSGLLGTFFLVFQGYEWASMIEQGFLLKTSNHSSFFYLIVGLHGLHVLGGLGGLMYAYTLLVRQRLTKHGFEAVRLFWYFVVGLWPVLYWLVYL